MNGLSALIFLLLVDQVSGKLIQAAVGDDVSFTLTDECKIGKGKLHHHLMDGTDQLVASLYGFWKPGPDYINRVNQSGDSLILKSADFNDHGHYAFTCNSKQKDELDELHIFLPSEVVVAEGQDATLPCRSITAGQSVKSARWRINGEVVLELNARTGKITYGNGFNETWVSIPSDWDRRADLSLTIKRAQRHHRGVYCCDIDKAEKHRSAVLLHVSIPPPPPPPLRNTSSPPSTPMPPECSCWTWIAFFITAAIVAVVGLLAWLGWYVRNKKFKVHTRGVGGGSSEHEENTNLRTFSISNGGGPLCSSKEEEEGGSEEDKESDCVQENMLKSNGYH